MHPDAHPESIASTRANFNVFHSIPDLFRLWLEDQTELASDLNQTNEIEIFGSCPGHGSLPSGKMAISL